MGGMQAQREPILQCRDLTKVYTIEDTNVVALDHVSLDVYPGEFVCVLGTSGSGKSTFLYLLAGIERPTSGKIREAGQRLDVMNESELVRFRRENVGFIFQSFNLLPYLSALENVAMPLTLRGINPYQRKVAAAKALKAVDLGKRAKHRPTQLSGGQQQRVSIARAIVTKPRILFADEPTGNLDSRTRIDIMKLLRREIDRSGATLIMVTHDEECSHYADRIVHIIDGRIVSIEENQNKISISEDENETV